MKKSLANSNFNNLINAGVIGFPISHSLSPTIHNFYLNKYKINGTYEAFEIPIENFEDSIKIRHLDDMGKQINNNDYGKIEDYYNLLN